MGSCQSKETGVALDASRRPCSLALSSTAGGSNASLTRYACATCVCVCVCALGPYSDRRAVASSARRDSGGTAAGQRQDSGRTAAGQRWDSGGAHMVISRSSQRCSTRSSRLAAVSPRPSRVQRREAKLLCIRAPPAWTRFHVPTPVPVPRPAAPRRPPPRRPVSQSGTAGWR